MVSRVYSTHPSPARAAPWFVVALGRRHQRRSIRGVFCRRSAVSGPQLRVSGRPLDRPGLWHTTEPDPPMPQDFTIFLWLLKLGALVNLYFLAKTLVPAASTTDPHLLVPAQILF